MRASEVVKKSFLLRSVSFRCVYLIGWLRLFRSGRFNSVVRSSFHSLVSFRVGDVVRVNTVMSKVDGWMIRCVDKVDFDCRLGPSFLIFVGLSFHSCRRPVVIMLRSRALPSISNLSSIRVCCLVFCIAFFFFAQLLAMVSGTYSLFR